MPLSRFKSPAGRSQNRVAARRRPRPRSAFGFDRLEPRLLLSDVLSGAPASGLIVPPYIHLETATVGLQMQAQVVVGGQTGSDSSPTILGPLSYKTLQTMGPEIDEVGSAHDTIAAAQKMPNFPVSMIDGTLAATDTLDLYAIPLSASTQSLHVDVVPTGSSTQLPRRLWMLDTSGDLIGDWPLPEGVTSFGLDIRPTGRVLDTQVIFGISHGTDLAPDPSSAPIQYQMIVEQQLGTTGFILNAADKVSSAPVTGTFIALAPSTGTVSVTPSGPVTFPSPPPPVSPSPSRSPAPTPSIPSAPKPSAFGGQPVGVSPGQSTGTGFIAINPSALALVPLPTRSAASFGGRLAEGSLAPPINRADLAMVDLNLIQLAPQSPAPVIASPADAMIVEATVPAEHAGEQQAPALVAVQGPGGFPILAAAILTTEARPSYPFPGAELPELLPDTDPMAASQRSNDPCPLPIVAPLAPVRSAARPQPGPSHAMNEAASRSRSPRRSPLLFSLNIAATLAFGLLLPDLVASWRNTRDRIPLPRLARFWVRTSRRGR